MEGLGGWVEWTLCEENDGLKREGWQDCFAVPRNPPLISQWWRLKPTFAREA